MNLNSEADWVKSIQLDPVYLNVTLSDISQAVPTNLQGQQKYLQHTIKAYIAQGKLPDTDGSIVDYDEFYAQFEDVPITSRDSERAFNVMNPKLRGGQ